MESDKSVNVVDSDTAMIESDLARDLREILALLGVEKLTSDLTAKQFFATLNQKVSEKLNKSSLKNQKPLLLEDGSELPPQSWCAIDKINKAMHDDYKVRRQMLISRCDCTVESFKWKKADNNDNKDLGSRIDNTYHGLRQKLIPEPTVDLPAALAARESGCFDLLNSVVSKSHQICDIQLPATQGLANIGKQQRISLQKFLIPQVPDRGGRPQEQPAPPKESFQHQNRQRMQGRGGGGGGGYRGGHEKHRDGGRGRGHEGHRAEGRGRGGYHNRSDRRPYYNYHDTSYYYYNSNSNSQGQSFY